MNRSKNCYLLGKLGKKVTNGSQIIHKLTHSLFFTCKGNDKNNAVVQNR